MQFSTIVAPLLLAASAVAQSAASGSAAPSQAAPASAGQSGAPSSGGAATPSGSVMVQVVKVGGNNGELKFQPEDIQAPPGSMVQFQFYPMNHSVAQSTFDKPCMPMSQNMPNGAASSELWSGFMPTQPGAQMMATWTIMVNDTTPIWLYCAQKNHCQQGMVAAINAKPTGDKTLSAFKGLASKATANVAPQGGMGGPNGANGTQGGAPGSGTSGSPASGSSPAASGNVKATGAASTTSFATSTMAIAMLLSVVGIYAL